MSKTHVSLNVSDVEKSKRFYQEFFGEAPHKERPGYVNFDLADPPLKLALNQGTSGLTHGALNHLGVQVESTESVLAAKARLQAAGLATFDEMETTCCYAKQDKIWVHDPDGNAWEVYAVTDDLDHLEAPRRTTGSAIGDVLPSACCGPSRQ